MRHIKYQPTDLTAFDLTEKMEKPVDRGPVSVELQPWQATSGQHCFTPNKFILITGRIVLSVNRK